jgi:hypothetical protein
MGSGASRPPQSHTRPAAVLRGELDIGCLDSEAVISSKGRKSFALESLPQTFGLVAPSFIALKAPKHCAEHDKRES